MVLCLAKAIRSKFLGTQGQVAVANNRSNRCGGIICQLMVPVSLSPPGSRLCSSNGNYSKLYLLLSLLLCPGLRNTLTLIKTTGSTQGSPSLPKQVWLVMNALWCRKTFDASVQHTLSFAFHDTYDLVIYILVVDLNYCGFAYLQQQGAAVPATNLGWVWKGRAGSPLIYLLTIIC